MSDFRTRMYNYEVAPPVEVWDAIEAELAGSHARVISIETATKNRSFSYMIAAASVILLLVAISVFRIQQSAPQNDMDGLATVYDTTSKHTYVMMTNPEGDKVKVSMKVAPIIVSAKKSKKTKWTDKMEKWKNTMMTATTTNFLDVIDIAKTDN